MVATPMALRKSTSKCMGWMLVTALVASVGLLRGVSAACAPCDNAESVLKPCNSSLQMNTWPGIYVYQPTDAQAQCACNQNFYDLMVSCLSCQSSTSAKLSVAPLDQYQLVCQSLGQTEFPKVYVPGQTSTTTTAAPSTNTPLATSGSNSGNNGAGHSNLSSGAVAGIVVSAIALIVALSVAGYVFAKRRRELAKQREEEELYKYQDATRSSYMESPLPQYTGIQSSLPSLPQLTNLRVMNPDNDDDDERGNAGRPRNQNGQSFDVTRTSPGWRRGSFDDD